MEDVDEEIEEDDEGGEEGGEGHGEGEVFVECGANEVAAEAGELENGFGDEGATEESGGEWAEVV